MTQTLRFYTLLLLISLSSSSLFSQTANKNEGCAPLPVHFTAPAGSTTYYWEFDDGGSSALANPNHTFITEKEHTITFRESAGGAVIGSITIKIYPKPKPSFAAVPQSGCVPLDVDFENTSVVDPNITVVNYNWVFGDGMGTNGDANPQHYYPSVNKFNVSLKLETDKEGCDTTAIFTEFIQVSDPPNPIFTTLPFPPVACQAPLNDVEFINNTPVGTYSFVWDFGGGNTYTGVNPPNQNYTENGKFPVTVTLEDGAGCVKQTQLFVGVGSPIPSFELPNDTLCVGQIYSLTNTSAAGQYNWEFQDGTPAASTQKEPNFRFDQPGQKTIKLTLTSPDGQCSNDTTITVWVEEIDVTLSVDPTKSCHNPVTLNYTATSNNASEWSYTFGDGTTSNVQNPTHVYTASDTNAYSINQEVKFAATLKVTSPAGCTATTSVVSTIHRPTALFEIDKKNGCVPVTVNFTDNSMSVENITEWHWDFGDGSSVTNSNGNSIEHVFNQVGQYPVTLIIVNDAGCTDTSYQEVISVGEPIDNTDFSVDKTDICVGESVTLTDLSNNSNIDTYNFSSGNEFASCLGGSNPTMTFNEFGMHDITMSTSYNGCGSTVTKMNAINVQGPIADLKYEMDCAKPFEFNFTSLSMGADSLFWDFGDGDTAMVATSVSHTYSAVGVYMVILRAKNNTSGCPESLDSVTVHVQDIKADFSIPEKVCRGKDLELDASTSKGVNGFCTKGYQWNSSERRPIVIGEPKLPFEFSFGQSGDQWVELIVDDVNGCRDTLRKNTRVFAVDVDAQADKTEICVPNSVSFTTNITSDTTLTIPIGEWDFADGIKTTGPSATHNFTNSNVASFNVTYVVKDILGCEGNATIPISVYEPTSIISAIPNPNICVGDTIAFSATDDILHGSFLTYAWDFGNGQTSTKQKDTIGYTTAGSFNVTLDFIEDATGCKGSKDLVVNVQDYPIADFISNVDDLAKLCYPLNVEFTDKSTPIVGPGLTTNWDFGNGTTAIGSTVFTAYEKGTFNITQIVSTTFGCKDTLVKSITTSGPEGDFTLDKNIICLGDEITVSIDVNDTVDVGSFYFDFGDGTEVHDSLTTKHTYTFTSQQPISLILTSVDGGCTHTISKNISIIDINAEFSNSNTTLVGCESEAFQFVNQSNGANQYQWNFGDGGTSSIENPSHIYNAAGTYTVTLIVDNTAAGCHDEITHDITILPKVPVSASDGSLCSGDSLLISVTNPNGGYIYNWTPELYASTPTESSTYVNPPITTDFIVTADDGSGCIGRDTITVYVVEPHQDISYDTTIFAGTTIQLPVEFSEPYIFSWNPQTGLSCLACSNPSITPQEDITYTLNIADGAGCFNSTGLFVIHIFPENIDIPNAFTPNGDGTNDFFNVILGEDVDVLVDITKFQIFDRWGQKVYDNNNIDRGWNGKFKEVEMPSDVYPYVVEATFINGKVKTFKGTVTLIR